MRDSSYSTGGSTGPKTPGTCSNVTAGYAGINDTRMSIFPGSAEHGLGIYIYIYSTLENQICVEICPSVLKSIKNAFDQKLKKEK